MLVTESQPAPVKPNAAFDAMQNILCTCPYTLIFMKNFFGPQCVQPPNQTFLSTYNLFLVSKMYLLFLLLHVHSNTQI